MSEAQKNPVSGGAGEHLEQIRDHLDSSQDLKERLQDELAELLLQPEEEDTDSGRLDALLAALEEIDPAPEDGMPDTEESLKRFHERHAELFSGDEVSSAGASEASSKNRRSRIAVFRLAFVAVVLVFFIGSVAAQAMGLNVLGSIARWSSEKFWFQSEEVPYATIRFRPLEEGEEATYDTLEEAVDAFGITAPIAPTWIPERFVLTGVTAAKRSGGILIWADYECDDGYFKIQYRETTNFDLYDLEKEAGVELYTCSGTDYYLMPDVERWKAYWQSGELECLMSGIVSVQEMRDIIDSIN